ncbi:MAG: hypothetical protein M3033_17760 [Acidobacteriota bacterium]|nr:hypothetical protein [Acidobacteriota bacterium]
MPLENTIVAKKESPVVVVAATESSPRDALVIDTTPKIYTETVKVLITLLAIAALFIYHKNGVALELPDVVLLALAVVPWLSVFIGSLKISKDGIEIQYLKQQVEQLKTEVKTEVKPLAEQANQTANTAKEAAFNRIGKIPAREVGAAKMIDGEDNNDLQKGRWGGSPTSNGRQLSARVEQIPGEDFFRRVVMRVKSTNPEDNPLTGSVTFHLHPTFTPKDVSVPVTGGAAEISRVAYGAFTVGAEADDGKTKMEFDLTKLDDGDPFFKR